MLNRESFTTNLTSYMPVPWYWKVAIAINNDHQAIPQLFCAEGKTREKKNEHNDQIRPMMLFEPAP
jgi:hypothetical protein